MAPPAKTSREAILAEAIAIVSEMGRPALTIRCLARKLSLAPNAIYSYFESLEDLQVAVTLEGWRRLLDALNTARHRSSGIAAVRKVSLAYVRFALEHPALYELMILPSPESEERAAIRNGFHQMNAAVYDPLVPKDLASQAPYMVWSALHGIVDLHRAGMLPDVDLESHAARSVEAMIRGLQQT